MKTKEITIKILRSSEFNNITLGETIEIHEGDDPIGIMEDSAEKLRRIAENKAFALSHNESSQGYEALQLIITRLFNEIRTPELADKVTTTVLDDGSIAVHPNDFLKLVQHAMFPYYLRDSPINKLPDIKHRAQLMAALDAFLGSIPF